LSELVGNTRRFVDRFSHEFRTPLTVIKEYAAVLRDGSTGSLTSKQREMLGTISDRADDLERMVHDMMDIGRLTSGMYRLWRRPTSVESIVNSIGNLLRDKAAVRSVCVSVESDQSSFYVDADKLPRSLARLGIAHLRLNGGREAIYVSGRRDGDMIEIRIACDGSDYETEELDLIRSLVEETPLDFDPADQNACSATSGVGWGPAVTKRVVELHFGTLDISQTSPSRVEFIIRLPQGNPQQLATLWYEEHGEEELSLLTVTPAADTPRAMDIIIGEFLQRTVGMHDLALSKEDGSWIILLTGGESELDETLTLLRENWQESLGERPAGMMPELTFAKQATLPAETSISEFLEKIKL
jgi:hypothetical protein